MTSGAALSAPNHSKANFSSVLFMQHNLKKPSCKLQPLQSKQHSPLALHSEPITSTPPALSRQNKAKHALTALTPIPRNTNEPALITVLEVRSRVVATIVNIASVRSYFPSIDYLIPIFLYIEQVLLEEHL